MEPVVLTTSAVGRRPFQTPKWHQDAVSSKRLHVLPVVEDGGVVATTGTETGATAEEEPPRSGAMMRSHDEDVQAWVQAWGKDLKPTGRPWQIDPETEAFMAALSTKAGESGGPPPPRELRAHLNAGAPSGERTSNRFPRNAFGGRLQWPRRGGGNATSSRSNERQVMFQQ